MTYRIDRYDDVGAAHLASLPDQLICPVMILTLSPMPFYADISKRPLLG